MTRQINGSGLDLVKSAEGLRLSAYRDTGGVWTIGYGHTRDAEAGQTCTPQQAETWLKADLSTAEDAVARLVTVPLADNQFAALVSFTFNVGATRLAQSTLLRKLNAGDYAGVPAQLKAWVFDNGNVQPGLVKRRAAEATLWSQK